MYYYNKKNKKYKKLPIVLIPGLFGSLGDDILPGTGKFDFGMAEPIYRPLINILEELGYKENKNLFIAFYDWRKDCEYNTRKYLIPKIEEAKRVSMGNKVDLMGHSLGGLVARTYIQGKDYNYDVRNLIMMGTPNSGAVNAYYFWSGGQLPYDKLEKSAIFQLLKLGFLWIYKFVHGPISDINLIRKLFPVAENLLPCYEYGDYLFYEAGNGIKKPVPIREMEAVNRLLNKLNSTSNSIYSRGVKPYHIIGTGYETVDIICVNRKERNRDKWRDGKPIYSISMPYGDGTITISSAEAIYSRNYYLNSNHSDILKNSKDILASILKYPNIRKKNSKVTKDSNCIYSIILRNVNNAEIYSSIAEQSININGNYSSSNLIIRKIEDNIYWIMVSLKEKQELKLKLYPIYEMDYEVIVFYSEKNREIEMVRKNFTGKKEDSNKSTISIFGGRIL